MFMLARRRREAERQKKLEEAFREADENGNGKITPQQMIKLFAANDVIGEVVTLHFGETDRKTLEHQSTNIHMKMGLKMGWRAIHYIIGVKSGY